MGYTQMSSEHFSNCDDSKVDGGHQHIIIILLSSLLHPQRASVVPLLCSPLEQEIVDM